MTKIVIIILVCLSWMGKKLARADFNCPPTTRPTFASEAELLTYLGVDIVCNSYNVEIYMNACALVSLGFDPLIDIAAGNASVPVLYAYDVQDQSCMGVDFGNGNVLYSFNLSMCTPVATVEASQIVYLLTLRSIASASSNVITRLSPFSVSFTCTYVLTMEKSLAHSVYPVYYASPVKMTTQQGEYNVMIALFTNDAFRSPLTAAPDTVPSVEVGKPVFLGLTIDTEETYMALEASSCWATYSAGPDDFRRYDILSAGCPNADAEKRGLQHLYSNFNSTTVEVSFRAFTWPKIPKLSQRMYIHCEVSICDWVLDQRCIKKSCPEEGFMSDEKEGEKIKKILTLGPINVQPKTTYCAESNGGCTHYCTVNGKGNKACQCPLSWNLEENGLTCKAAEAARKPLGNRLSIEKRDAQKFEDSSSTGTAVYVWSTLSVVFVIACAAVFGAYARSIKRRSKGRFDL